MFNAVGGHVTREQRALLKSSNFRIRPLSRAGVSDIWQAIAQTLLPYAAFVAALVVLILAPLRYAYPVADYALCVVCVAALLLPVAISFFTLAVGVAAARTRAQVRWPAVIFWLWWPWWKLVLCCIAVAAGVAIGNSIWCNHLYEYSRLTSLQAYTAVDPLRVGGVRLQDAGLVTFNETAGVDRGRTACLRNGPTYCVAPVVHGGALPAAGDEGPQLDLFNGDGSRRQQYDFFMVGKNCCDCPGEFRCGDWMSRGPVGGLRQLSQEDQDFYRIATEQWQTNYGRLVRHAVFLTWVDDPFLATEAMVQRAKTAVFLSLVLAPVVLIVLSLALNAALFVAVEKGWAMPMPTPLPTEISQFQPGALQPTDFQAGGDQLGLYGSTAADPKYVVL